MASSGRLCNLHAPRIRDNCLSLGHNDITLCDHHGAAGSAHMIGNASCHLAQQSRAHWAGQEQLCFSRLRFPLPIEGLPRSSYRVRHADELEAIHRERPISSFCSVYSRACVASPGVAPTGWRAIDT